MLYRDSFKRKYYGTNVKTNQPTSQRINNQLNKNIMKGKLKCNPMNQFPTQVEGEDFSKTVLVYDIDLEDFDLGYYNYDTKNWEVMGGFQMKLICWSEVPLPQKLVVSDFEPYLTN